jgi:hypothetical protein
MFLQARVKVVTTYSYFLSTVFDLIDQGCSGLKLFVEPDTLLVFLSTVFRDSL